ncbi:MAG: hypothetical protein GY946_15555 [bacterium]|nr:hypothetical protein [bacterium]
MGTLWAVRCHAYVLPSELYREIEAQILEQLGQGEREHLVYLLEEHDLDVELLSGEWRVLFEAAKDYFQVVDPARARARMAVSPEQLAEFVSLLGDPERQKRWRQVSFGLDELRDALPPDCDLAGVVLVEESDDWLWVEQVNEIIAIRPEVFSLIESHLRSLLDNQNFAAARRLAGDHSEGAVEFDPERWSTLLRHADDKVPELRTVIEARLSGPDDYTAICEALALISDPKFQPSLDAWIRVHADTAQYALYFRDVELEQKQLEQEEGQAQAGA